MRKEPQMPALRKRVQPRKLVVTIVNNIDLRLHEASKEIYKWLRKLEKLVT